MRVDKAKNTAKVLKEVINNPLQSQREIAENSGVSKSSVDRAMKELGEIGANEHIVDFVKLDMEIQELASKEIKRRLIEETDKVNNQDIVRFNETSLKRSQLLGIKNENKEFIVKFEI